ncbi:MAG: TIGR02588 family protein [Sphingomonas sp.]
MAAKEKKASGTPLLEWIAAGIGLALLLGLLSVIGREALRGGPTEPPAIEVSVRRIAATPSGYVVEFEARNIAGGTAQSVDVEGMLTSGGAPVERSGITFDYIPGHSHRSGGLFFRRDPRQGVLALRALGYQIP